MKRYLLVPGIRLIGTGIDFRICGNMLQTAEMTCQKMAANFNGGTGGTERIQHNIIGR